MCACVHTCAFSAEQNTKCFSLHRWQIHKSQWFMLRGFSIARLPFFSIIWKRILLAAQMIILYWQHRRRKPWSMSKRVPERLWQKVIFFSIFRTVIKWAHRFIIQSACAHTIPWFGKSVPFYFSGGLANPFLSESPQLYNRWLLFWSHGYEYEPSVL